MAWTMELRGSKCADYCNIPCQRFTTFPGYWGQSARALDINFCQPSWFFSGRKYSSNTIIIIIIIITHFGPRCGLDLGWIFQTVVLVFGSWSWSLNIDCCFQMWCLILLLLPDCTTTTKFCFGFRLLLAAVVLVLVWQFWLSMSELNFTQITENNYVVQMILVMLHDLQFNVVRLLRQQFELLEIRAARSELVFCVVAVFSCNINNAIRQWPCCLLSFITLTS